MIMTVVCLLKYSAPLFIRKGFQTFHMLPDVVVSISIYTRAYTRVCVAPYSDQSSSASKRVGKRTSYIPVRLLGRERLACISVACVIGNYFKNFYTMPSCRRNNSRLLDGIRCALRYLAEGV